MVQTFDITIPQYTNRIKYDMITVAQALLVQSALSAMSQQRRTSKSEAQCASAGGTQPSSSTVAAQLRAENDANSVAAVERAQEVGAHSARHSARQLRTANFGPQ